MQNMRVLGIDGQNAPIKSLGVGELADPVAPERLGEQRSDTLGRDFFLILFGGGASFFPVHPEVRSASAIVNRALAMRHSMASMAFSIG